MYIGYVIINVILIFILTSFLKKIFKQVVST